MTSAKDALQDKALAELKLTFQIISEFESAPSKDMKLIFEYALRFTLAELARTIHQLSAFISDALLIEKAAFLTLSPVQTNLSIIQPSLLALQKYLLATLL
jgi:hypothetical protein